MAIKYNNQQLSLKTFIFQVLQTYENQATEHCPTEIEGGKKERTTIQIKSHHAAHMLEALLWYVLHMSGCQLDSIIAVY